MTFNRRHDRSKKRPFSLSHVIPTPRKRRIIEKENRHVIHEQISGLLRNVTGEMTEQEFSLIAAIEFLDEAARLDPLLLNDWSEVKSILSDLIKI
jgi:hypothetical protein